MNRTEQIERLAEELMGWHKYEYDNNTKWNWIKKGNIMARQASPNWNPFEKWNDAGMILERVKTLSPATRYAFTVAVCKLNGATAYEILMNLTPAIISEAALKTLEVKE